MARDFVPGNSEWVEGDKDKMDKVGVSQMANWVEGNDKRSHSKRGSSEEDSSSIIGSSRIIGSNKGKREIGGGTEIMQLKSLKTFVFYEK